MLSHWCTPVPTPRRGVWRRSAAPLVLAAAFALATPAGAAAQQWIPIRSGLPWASGANGCCGGMTDLERMRGRKLDFRTSFLPFRNWTGMVAGASNAGGLVSDGAAAVVAFGMMPESHRGQHRQCRQGQFDRHIRALGNRLVRAGAPRAVLRLGWEANRPNGFPWGVVPGTEREYIGCFRRWVSVLRAVPRQRFVVDWNMQDKVAYPTDRIYPGGDVVDVIGVNPYDRCKPVRTEAQFDRWLFSKAGDGRNPRGPGSWLQFAQARGKKLSIPEWGIGGPSKVRNCSETGFDNPMFVRKWHAFLKANARSIAYEGYFNAHGYKDDSLGSTKLAPAAYNPRSSAVYKELWGTRRAP